jgi:hypothetical protein
MKIITLIFSILLLTSCSSSENVYLEKSSLLGKWERVAIMFGYYDNYDACMEINKALTDKYPGNVYRCTPINNSLISVILNNVKS